MASTNRNQLDNGNYSPLSLNQKQKDDVNKIKPYVSGAGKIGQFEENAGGGTPAQGGGRGAMKKKFVLADDPDDPAAQKAKAEGKPVRYMQPRDDDGRFTYNSANAKKLYYGEKSRGVTDVPFLGGKLVEKIEKEGTDVVIGQDKLSYLFHNKELTAYKAKEELREYMTNHGKKDYTDSGKNIINKQEQAYEHKKGRKSAAEQQALQQGVTGKIGEKSTVNGKTKYSYMSKVVTPANGNVMSKYFDANGNPIGKNVIKPNNPNITPKTVTQQAAAKLQQVAPGKGNSGAQQPAQSNQPKPQAPQQQAQQAAPQQQAPAQKKPLDYSQKIDASAVASNPKKFISDNREIINDIVNQADQLGLSLDVNTLVKFAQGGQISSFQDVLNELNKYKK